MATQRALRELNTSPRAMRSPSLSSDVHSTRSAATPVIPEANPLPTFVASGEASQLVSSEVDDSVNVKDQALLLLNSFLDHILYTILSTAKSVQLARLRDAVPVVLKPRLGKAALGAADEELKEYLNEGDDDILTASESRSEPKGDFDLDLAWKLARLRCMVYTRLGDMEEEDEEEYIESEQLHPGSGTYTNAAHRASTVKAASAIFLTSVLEYLGEQALLYAVQNTQRRAQAPRSPVALKLDGSGPMSPPIHQSMVLDESDMFYVGRESPLSRLWRSWRRQTRSPMETVSRQISPIRDEHQLTSEKTPRIDETAQEEIQESGLPHQVPLPISGNDVNEIEVPGLAREIVDDGDAPPPIRVPERSKKRPVSMIINNTDAAYQTALDSPRTMTIKQRRRSRSNFGHTRSISHPTPERQIYSSVSSIDAQHAESPDFAEDADGGNSEHPTFETASENAPRDSLEQPSEKEESKEGNSEAGIAATAVSAVAAASGIGALASSKKANETERTEPRPKPLRTVADRMVGTTLQVASPNDAGTGSSITSVSDFDNMHVPLEKPEASEEPEHVSGLDSSDPEDLALSSGDEDAPQIPSGRPVSDSRYLRYGEQVAPPQPSSASKATGTEVTTSNAPSLSPKAISRQVEVFNTSQEAAKEHAQAIDQQEPDRPLWSAPVDKEISTVPVSNHKVVTIPAMLSSSSIETTINRNAVSEGYAQPEKGTIRESVVSRPSTATTTIQSSVPPRVSSDRSRFGHAHTDSRTSQYSQESKRSSSSSKLLGFTRDQDGRPQTGTSQGLVMQSIHAYATSSPRNGREVRSDGSNSAKESLKVETIAARNKDVSEAEAKKQSLEILIRGDETLHYTLTPVSARGENFPLPGHSPTTSRNLSSRDGSSAAHNKSASGTSNSINGLRANPVNGVASSSSSRPGYSAYESPVGGIVNLTSTQAKSRTNRAQPRDARLDNTTMMDLADYARSTGPENEQQLPKPLSSRPGTGATAKTVRSTTNTVRTVPALSMPTNRPTTQQSQGSKSVGARARFQAREPTVARRSGTNDLIEFLREGPPSSAGGVNGNVSNENGRASAASTQNSSVAPRSIQESTHSSTALLASNRGQAQRVNGVKPTDSVMARAPPPQRDPMPARKQRRIRDPYAIDESDDDLDEEQTSAQAKRTQDESLIDFLRNTAPPPGSSPPPILAGSSAGSSSAAAAAAVTRQPSTQGIRERVMRSASRSSLNRKASVNNHQPAVRNDEPPQYYKHSGRARESSPHLSQTGKKIDTYKPTTVTHAPHVDRNRAQLKARAPTSTRRTGTADLADYLKNSGPPDVPAAPLRQSSIVKDDSGFLKFFSRRRAMK